jgi:hypothetical protein
MAFKDWDANFEVEPADTDLVSESPAYQNEDRENVRRRLDVEHDYGTFTEGSVTSEDSSRHRMGSARCFVYAGVPPGLDKNDTSNSGAGVKTFDEGRMWFNTVADSHQLYVWRENPLPPGDGWYLVWQPDSLPVPGGAAIKRSSGTDQHLIGDDVEISGLGDWVEFDPDDDTSFNVAVTLPSDPKNTYGVEINAHICGELILSIPGDGIFGCTMDGRFTKHLGGAGSPSPILGTEQMIYHYQKFEVSETPHLYRYNTCPTMHHIDTDFNWPGDEGKVVTYRVEVGSREIWNSITTSDNAFTWRSNYRNGFVGGAYTSLQSSYISARVVILGTGYVP